MKSLSKQIPEPQINHSNHQKGGAVFLVAFLIIFGCALPACADEVSMEELQNLIDNKRWDDAFARCTEAITDGGLPDADALKAKVYVFRAIARYNRVGGGTDKEEMILSGLDVVRAVALDPENRPGEQFLNNKIALSGMESLLDWMAKQPKASLSYPQAMAKHAEISEKQRDEFLRELEKRAKQENIEGFEIFFQKK